MTDGDKKGDGKVNRKRIRNRVSDKTDNLTADDNFLICLPLQKLKKNKRLTLTFELESKESRNDTYQVSPYACIY